MNEPINYQPIEITKDRLFELEVSEEGAFIIPIDFKSMKMSKIGLKKT